MTKFFVGETKNTPSDGDFEQRGPDLYVWTGTEWVLFQKDLTAFEYMCIAMELTPEEIEHQKKLRGMK